MSTTGRTIKSGWRATFALLILSFGIFAPSVKLMLPEPVTCGMACCLERGVCYCHSKSVSHSKDKAGDHSQGEGSQDEVEERQTSQMEAVALTSSCPAQCAQVPAGFQSISIIKARPPEYQLVIDAAQLIYARTMHFARDALINESSAPRAPPATLLRNNPVVSRNQ